MLHISTADLLQVALLGLAVAALILLLISDCAVRRQLARPLPARGVRSFVSVMKPMKGCDEELCENLVAFATQRYPAYELLCGVATWDDPACAVARRVQREHPECGISVRVCDAEPGLNPEGGLPR